METSQRVKIRWKKKIESKKLQLAPPGFEPAHQLPPAQNVKPRTTGPCDHCHSHCLNLWRSIYHDFKDTIDEKLLKQVFPSHFALFLCLFILRLYKGRSMNALVFFRCTRWSSGRRYSPCCKPVKPGHYSVLRPRILRVLLTLCGKMT